MIVFEGIDNSGKTTLSKRFLEHVRRTSQGEPWHWTKEPDFTTEEADRLNDPSQNIDEYCREEMFLASRMRRQSFYKENNCVVDRYLWTGLAYAKIFSPNAYPFAEKIYTGNIFVKPNMYIFVDTPVEICDQRDPSVGLDRLRRLRQAYLDVMPLIRQPILTVESVGNIDDAVSTLIERYESFTNI